MDAMFNRTRSMLALVIAVVFVAVASLAGAPTASACGIDDDGHCIVTQPVVRTPAPPAKSKHAKKQKHAKSKKARIQRSHSAG
jgi:hypothetical protein